MRSYRLSIAGVLGVVLVVALGLALLRAADEFWASVAYSLAILAALVAVVGALFADRGLRAFCAGFATFAAVDLILVFSPFSTEMESPNLVPGVAGGVIVGGDVRATPSASMATTFLLRSLHAVGVRNMNFEVGANVQVLWRSTYWSSIVIEKKDGEYKIHYDNSPSSTDEWVDLTRIASWNQNRREFLKVGHSLLALVLGMIGGAVAVAFRLTRERRDPPETATP